MGEVTAELLARLLRLDEYGMRVVSLVDADDGEAWVQIETTASIVGCHECGVRARSKARPMTLIRDLEVAGRPIVVVWHKRRWQCREADCDVKTWTELCDFARPRSVVSERARAEICRSVGEDNESVASQARRFGVGWQTAWKAVVDFGQSVVDDPARFDGVRSLGIDETNFMKATPNSPTRYVTSFVDLDGPPRVLDLVDGRNADDVGEWLDDRGLEWQAGVDVCAIDPHRGYYNAVTSRLDCPIVLDPFHTVRLANRRVDQARRRVQNETLGHRGRKRDPLYRARKLMLMAVERHTDRSWDRLQTAFSAGDPYEEVAVVWVGKELLRQVYLGVDRRDANRRLVRFYEWCADHCDIAELVSLAKVIEAWQDQLLNFFDDRYTNARTESLNFAIKNVKRVGRSFRNFDNYRLRVLLHTGTIWNTPDTARLRTRTPRLAA